MRRRGQSGSHLVRDRQPGRANAHDAVVARTELLAAQQLKAAVSQHNNLKAQTMRMLGSLFLHARSAPSH